MYCIRLYVLKTFKLFQAFDPKVSEARYPRYIFPMFLKSEWSKIG